MTIQTAEICRPQPARVRLRPVTPAAFHAVIVSVDAILCAGLQHLIEKTLPGRAAVDGYEHVGNIIDDPSRPQPDVVLLDAETLRGECIAAVRVLSPRMHVIVIGSRADAVFRNVAITAGADEVLFGDEMTEHDLTNVLALLVPASARSHLALVWRSQAGSVVEHSLRSRFAAPTVVAAKHSLGQLSPRECEVLAEMAKGQRNAEIGRTLRMTEKTVKNHINRIFAKLNVDTRARAVLLWINHTAAPPVA